MVLDPFEHVHVSNEDNNMDCSPLSQILYRPEKSHDYLAFVLLMNTLIFPFTLQGYSYNHVQMPNLEEQIRLLRLCSALEANEPWREMIATANWVEMDLVNWRDMLCMLQWLW